MMKPKFFLCAALLAMSVAAATAAEPSRPNILVIYSDDHGWADLGIQGTDKDIRTPHLDQLARDGVRFVRGYVSAPQCVPSRAGLLTGRYQQRFGVEDNNRGPLPLAEQTIAERLAAAGYTSGWVGKCHLDIGVGEGDVTAAAQGKGKRKGKVQRILSDHMPHRQGFAEYFRGELRDYHASHALDGTPFADAPRIVRDTRFRVEVQTDAAVSFLERRAAAPQQPWFLYLAWYAPHVPLESPEPWFSRTPESLPLERRQALAMIAAMDDGLGRIREKLRALGVEKNTLIFFIGDNGAPLGTSWNGSLNTPLAGQKGMLSEGGIRTPFLGVWPGHWPAGTTYDQPVINLDVAATAVAAAGLPADPVLDGVDLTPFVTGRTQGSPHDRLFWRWGSQSAVLEMPMKLIRLGDRPPLLFDVTTPEGENVDRNLAASRPDVVERLDGQLRQWAAALEPPGLFADSSAFSRHHEALFAEHRLIARGAAPPAEVRADERENLRRMADLALIPPVPNTEPLPQYDYDKLDYGMTIGIERTPKGRLWACWVAGGDSPKAFFVLATSDDDGETWSKPRLVLDSHSRTLPRDRSILVGNLWTDPVGRLWLFFDQSMQMFDGRGGLWATVCENPDAEKPAWSRPRRIWHGVMLNKPTVLSTGEWMLPISLDQRDGLGATDPPQMFGPFRGIFPELDPFRGANVFVSTDQGATWQRRGGVKFTNPDWHEHMIVERRDKSLWMLARTGKGIMQSTSTDGGRTWAEPTEPPGIRQPNARFHVRRLASGKLLLVKHGDRIDAHEGRVKLSAWLSNDDGATWQGGLVLDERKGISYPDGFQAPDGTIFISYDRNRATDGEILLARFTEADMLAGQLVGPKSRLKMLISRPLAPRAAASPHALAATANVASLQPPRHIGPPLPEQAVTNRAFTGIPSLAVAPGGRLWATWYAGVTPAEDLNNYVVLSTSDDGGSTWQEVLTVDPDGGGSVRAFDPELWVSPDGRLFFFWAQMEKGRRDTEHGVWCIETATPDAARPAWSQPRRIGDGVMMCKPTVLAAGEWVLPISRWKEHGESAQCVVSADAGKTWLRRGGCNVPVDVRNYDEHMFVERKDGALWLLVRTTYGIGQSVSTDRGKTWPELTPSDILHTTSRFFISRLTSGNLLLVKHGPLDARTSRSHLTAYVSADDGRTWTGGLLLDERLGVSYPDGQETPDGLIRIIYDYNRVTDRNILMATFREQDVAAGKDVSGGVRLRQLVSKASGGQERPPASQAAVAANADGKPLRKARPGTLASSAANAQPLVAGARLFSDRDYVAATLPEPLAGAHFLPVAMNGQKTLTVERAGTVFFLTPVLDRNRDTAAQPLMDQGFEKVALPEVPLFRPDSPANFCTLFQKDCAVGETILIGKWAVPVFVP